jgi:hypothetical protein
MTGEMRSLFRLVGDEFIGNHDHQPDVASTGTVWLISSVPNQVPYVEALRLTSKLAAERTV